MGWLYNATKDAVQKAKRSYGWPIAAASPLVVIRVQDLAFPGVSRAEFSNAITSKTPYTPDSTLFECPDLKVVLETVWRAVNSRDLYFWSSWYVLDVASPFVDKVPWDGLSYGAYRIKCVRMVWHVIGTGLAALSGLNKFTEEAQAKVAKMTNSVADCLKRKPWTESVQSSPRLILGLPSYANSIEQLDAFYKDVLLVRGSFFESWLLAAHMRRFSRMRHFDHVEPLSPDVYTGTDGTVLVPALLSRVPYFAQDGPWGTNVAGLGHRIAQSLVHRYFDRPDTVPDGWKALTNKERGVHIESLVAYSCVRSVLYDMEASDKVRLPEFPGLPAEKLAYVVGCLKEKAEYK